MINMFISDLHLEEARPDISAIFLKFLQQDAQKADALYILGDFFEVWIGDDDLSSFNVMIMDALAEATRNGLQIYIMHGNRDFLLGKSFCKRSRCQLISDEYVISIAGVPHLLMHGDTLCTDDTAYLKFRKKSRIWFFQKLFLLKSLATRKKIAADMREKSKAYTSTAPEKIMDVTQAEVERVMTKHNVQHLIHGHTHRPAVHEFNLNGSPATRTVLAPWHEYGSLLICDDDGNNEVVMLT
ncbi:MAG: UDP-2,3-diacylglucosamine diphosphatase [Gammaproteobacteria bacterium]|nr:UDP-2,3-diacylglucosamine diphosphatase [Gammaproteobacteria bacterium]